MKFTFDYNSSLARYIVKHGLVLYAFCIQQDHAETIVNALNGAAQRDELIKQMNIQIEDHQTQRIQARAQIADLIKDVERLEAAVVANKLSRRDKIAAMMLQGLISDYKTMQDIHSTKDNPALLACKLADGLIFTLDQK